MYDDIYNHTGFSFLLYILEAPQTTLVAAHRLIVLPRYTLERVELFRKSKARGLAMPFDPHIADEAKAFFCSQYGGEEPMIVAMAPGRVNLIGEHTDYQNGFVAPMALEKYTAIAASFEAVAEGTVPVVRCTSKNFRTGSFEITPGAMKPLPRSDPSSWMNYLMGVVDQYYEPLLSKVGVSVNISLAIVSSVPFGSGLSSSAALETAMAKVVEGIACLASKKIGTWSASVLQEADRSLTADRLLTNLGGDRAKANQVLEGPLSGKLNGVATALRCQKAEHVFGGVMCGIMDQYVSSLASQNNAVMIDCYSLASFEIPMPDDVAVIVTQTKVQHSLGDSAYNTRVKECQEAVRILNLAYPEKTFTTLRDVDDVSQLEDAFTRMSLKKECMPPSDSIVFRRARHVVGENSRVEGFRSAMLGGHYDLAGTLMYESHDSLRDDYEVSCAELDELVDIARSLGKRAGVIGARMTGGGFGGCTVTMVRADCATAVCSEIEKRYKALHPELLKDAGEIAFVTAAGRGAGILEPKEALLFAEPISADTSASLILGLPMSHILTATIVGAGAAFVLSRYWSK